MDAKYDELYTKLADEYDDMKEQWCEQRSSYEGRIKQLEDKLRMAQLKLDSIILILR